MRFQVDKTKLELDFQGIRLVIGSGVAMLIGLGLGLNMGLWLLGGRGVYEKSSYRKKNSQYGLLTLWAHEGKYFFFIF